VANPITYQEIKDLLTQSDIFNGIDAGIVPTGTSSGEELIQQDLDLYEYLKTEGDPRFINTEFSNILVQEPSSNVRLNSFDFPVYLIRSTTPANGQGARGRIIFSSSEELGKKVLIGIGKIDYNSYDIGRIDFAFGEIDSPFEFKDVTLTSEDFNTLALGEQIINDLQLQLTNFYNGKFKDSANFFIVSGTNPNTPPENINEYTFQGRIESEANNNKIKNVYISDNLNTQGLLGSSVYSNPDGAFELHGEYIGKSSNAEQIYDTIEYIVKSGDSLSSIAQKYPQQSEDGNDIPFYPDRTMQIYKANPIMEGRSIPLSQAVNESQVLENADLIFPGETIFIPFYEYNITTKPFTITFEKEGFIPKTITPLTSKKTIITSYQKILLKPKEPSKKEAIQNNPMSDSQVKVVTDNSRKQDAMGGFTDELLQGMIKNINKAMIPFVLSLIARFGVNSISDAIKLGLDNIIVQCPANLDELNDIIRLKNKLTKQLNNLYAKLDTLKSGVEIANTVITIANVVFASISALVLAFPSIPFAPDVTKYLTSKIIVGKNSNGTPTTKSIQEVISDTLLLFGTISASTLLVLNILTQKIQEVLNYLSLLDDLIEKCAIAGALPQEELTLNLSLASIDQSLQGSPVITNINGFEIKVAAVDNIEVDGLKRRQALARNDQGVIMLRGEPSFSSNDQILIDELTFLIKQNNLKAD
tara:strand:+ start:1421 stop:3523 length:2103 start_codon:yes stop_codon:yes gene_type:complete